MKVIEDSTKMPATHLQAAQLRLPFGTSDAEDNGDLSCTEPGCIRTFRKPSTLEKHLAVGNHLYHVQFKWKYRCYHGAMGRKVYKFCVL